MIASGISQAGTFLSRVVSVNRLAKENEEFKARAKAVEVSEAREADRQQELANLNKLMGQPDYGRTKVPAHVIGYFPSENRFRLSIGKKQGVAAGQPVIAYDGLVGQVSTVENDSCDVSLVVSPGLRVSAVMESTSRFVGILKGETPRRLVMEIVDPVVNPRAGDEVVTSGMTEFYPRGIVIGDVVEVKESRDFGYRRAYVSPRVRFDDVTEVFVLQ